MRIGGISGPGGVLQGVGNTPSSVLQTNGPELDGIQPAPLTGGYGVDGPPALDGSLSLTGAPGLSGMSGVSGTGFGEHLADAIDGVNRLQSGADGLVQKLAAGDVQDVHQVMLALNQASNAFGLTVQVRNKALEAYQEIMRMQV
jgi:flagellar hook-basal body complex protein FliE